MVAFKTEAFQRAVKSVASPHYAALVYGPDAVWDGDLPPKPEYFMHQLWALGETDLPRFDSKIFAQRVHQLLGTVHP